jgi:hypothetical protein
MPATRGTPPSRYGEDKQRQLLRVLNTSATGLYGQVVKSMPVGIGGRLQRSWTLTLASLENPQASIGTNSTYFLPLELGRKPGSGISKEGQDSVTLWAQRKLTLSEPEARGLAFTLSQKYKREGRPATGLIGLALAGAPGGQPIPKTLEQTIPGSLLNNALQELERNIKQV